jgi:predicted nucleotidyltransferase
MRHRYSSRGGFCGIVEEVRWILDEVAEPMSRRNEHRASSDGVENPAGRKVLRRRDVLGLLEENVGILRSFGVRRLGLFGSFGRDEATPSSDIDFIVQLEVKTFDAYMELKFFLEDLFGRGVDLVLDDAIKPRLRPYIEKEVVYAKGL